jgi:hypothetical protein
MPDANGWAVDVQWGAATARDGQNITWGLTCPGANCNDGSGWVTWGASSDSDNVVWGDACGGADCLSGQAGIPGTPGSLLGATGGATVVWGTAGSDTVVWGTTDDDTVVWGTTCEDASCSTRWSGQ